MEKNTYVLDYFFLSDCPADGRTWVPNGDKCFHFVHGKEDSIKSYTFDRAKSLCQGFSMSHVVLFFLTTLLKEKKKTAEGCIFNMRVSLCVTTFLELLTIQSAEENDFVIKYSPEVWKGNVNVWLGMYYDTNSEYRVTRRTGGNMLASFTT